MDMERKSRVNPALIRALNTARVFHAVRKHPGASQRRLAEITELDKSTISAIVARLVADGLLSRTPTTSGRRGRPEVALYVSREGGSLIGARLEPGSVRLVAATLTGEPVATLERPAADDPAGALDDLVQGVRDLLAQGSHLPGKVRAVGVVVPALFDEHGALALAPNLGWSDVPMLTKLRDVLPMPVYVDNDTTAAGLAESLFGSCGGVRDFLFIAGHSGIGGALYLGGRLYRGHSGFAGEVGHVRVRPGGRACACGGRGCLEAYVSEAALLRAAHAEGLAVIDLAGLASAHQEGREAAEAVLAEAGEALGDACAMLINVLNPERIVLGGTIAYVADRMLPTVERRLAVAALEPPRSRCRVTMSSFGAEAATMGGVALALEGFLSMPGWLLDRGLPDAAM